MVNVNQEVFEEAVKRLMELTEKYNLNPNILRYFKDGKVYYSYLTASGLIGSIDTITYDSRYEKAVQNFEKKYKGHLVFHAIESITVYGRVLSLLYVGEKENWNGERLFHDYIAVYVVNLDFPENSEFGDIVVQSFEESGALIRKA